MTLRFQETSSLINSLTSEVGTKSTSAPKNHSTSASFAIITTQTLGEQLLALDTLAKAN